MRMTFAAWWKEKKIPCLFPVSLCLGLIVLPQSTETGVPPCEVQKILQKLVLGGQSKWKKESLLQINILFIQVHRRGSGARDSGCGGHRQQAWWDWLYLWNMDGWPRRSSVPWLPHHVLVVEISSLPFHAKLHVGHVPCRGTTSVCWKCGQQISQQDTHSSTLC